MNYKNLEYSKPLSFRPGKTTDEQLFQLQQITRLQRPDLIRAAVNMLYMAKTEAIMEAFWKFQRAEQFQGGVPTEMEAAAQWRDELIKKYGGV